MSVSPHIGRALLALLGGHLFALASFELCRAWAFSPYVFRPLITLLLVFACGLVFGLHQLAERKAYRCPLLFVAWMALVGMPLNLSGGTVLFGLAILAAILSVTCAPPRGAGYLLSTALVLAAFGYSLQCHWLVACLLLIASLFEIFRAEPVAPWRDVEVTWEGFESMSAESVPAEAEAFKTKVLEDTKNLLRACGALCLQSTEDGGLFRFDDVESLEVGQFHLQEYRERVCEVLEEAQISALKLSVK